MKISLFWKGNTLGKNGKSRIKTRTKAMGHITSRGSKKIKEVFSLEFTLAAWAPCKIPGRLLLNATPKSGLFHAKVAEEHVFT